MSTTVFHNSTAVEYHRPMGLGSIIRERRLAKGWTLEQLSEKTDGAADPGTISALELRDSERSKYFPVLARALGETMESLAGGPPATPSTTNPPAADPEFAALYASFLLLDAADRARAALKVKHMAEKALLNRQLAAQIPKISVGPPTPKPERSDAA